MCYYAVCLNHRKPIPGHFLTHLNPVEDCSVAAHSGTSLVPMELIGSFSVPLGESSLLIPGNAPLVLVN